MGMGAAGIGLIGMAANSDEEADWVEFEVDGNRVHGWLWMMPMRNGDEVEVVAVMNLIRLDDDTDHGGKVITASSTMRFDGRFVARKGDEVSCPKHPDVKPNLIEEGDPSITDDGVPVARHGHRATCGCHLISSLT